jgi:hypothetical protein
MTCPSSRKLEGHAAHVTQLNAAMTDIAPVTRSLWTVRLRARVPQIIVGLCALILMAAGVRATFAPRTQSAAPRPVARTVNDEGAEAFAEGFARAYLSWDTDNLEDRAQRLKPYVGALDADGGLQPARGTSQQVMWTAVVGESRAPEARLITLAVQTTRQLVHLSVPVSRDRRGYLSIRAYPAVVGPPAIDPEATAPRERDVDDDALVDVVERAVRNYLAASRTNLLADLTPDALVSLPSEPLTVTHTDRVSWVTAAHRVAVEVDARDRSGSTWTLRYELEVRKRDRWYVQSVQVDPTFRSAG